jgi:hypothetical protein
MDRDRSAQAAIPHLPRIRMNARGGPSAKSGILPCGPGALFDLDETLVVDDDAALAAASATTSRPWSCRATSGSASPTPRSSVTPLSSSARRSATAKDRQREGVARSTEPWMASPSPTCPRTGQGHLTKTTRRCGPLRGPPPAGEPTFGIGRRASHLDGLALCDSLLRVWEKHMRHNSPAQGVCCD